MKNISENKIIIATGGTGGHVIPAYSLAKDLIKKNFDVKIITDSRGLVFLEKFQDVKLILNNSSTVYGKNILKIFFSSIRIIISVINSLIILFKIKPFLSYGGSSLIGSAILAGAILNFTKKNFYEKYE